MKKFWVAATVLVFAVGALSLSACGKKRPERALLESNRSESSREGQAAEEAAPEEAGPDLPAGQVAVTRVVTEGDGYSLTLNGVLGIRGVKIESGASGEFLAWPRRKDGERGWNYLRVNRADMPALLAVVKGGAPATAPQGFSITGTHVKMLENATGKRKAFVEFELNGGAVKLSSWAIIQGTQGPFLVPPSERRGADYEDVVFAVSPEFRTALQVAALEAYKALGGDVPDGAIPASSGASASPPPTSDTGGAAR